MSDRQQEPTIDWLIDQLAPNEGNSPLVEFNKKRLKQAIRAEVDKARRELNSIWNNPGRMPSYHHEQQARLRREWPMLYKWIVTHLNTQESEDTDE